VCPPNAALWCTPPASTSPAAQKVAADGTCVRCLNVRMAVKPNRREEFLASILADQAGTLANEPLALAFVIGEDLTVENLFYLHEQYVGEAGFQAHLRAAHFQPWQAFVNTEPFFGPLEVQFYDQM
jgi:quinol monooxygenase YgiN